MASKIETFQDLIDSKKDLKEEISSLEAEIKNNKIVQVSNLFVGGKHDKIPSLDSLHIPHVKDIVNSPIGNVLSTFLLSNKKIRKYFIGFVIIRETVPYLVSEISKLIEEKK